MQARPSRKTVARASQRDDEYRIALAMSLRPETWPSVVSSHAFRSANDSALCSRLIHSTLGAGGCGPHHALHQPGLDSSLASHPVVTNQPPFRYRPETASEEWYENTTM
jgi:hypothetical protein